MRTAAADGNITTSPRIMLTSEIERERTKGQSINRSNDRHPTSSSSSISSTFLSQLCSYSLLLWRWDWALEVVIRKWAHQSCDARSINAKKPLGRVDAIVTRIQHHGSSCNMLGNSYCLDRLLLLSWSWCRLLEHFFRRDKLEIH